MISTKKELKFYIMADMMMNRGRFKWSLKDRIKHLFLPDDIMQYLKSMRYCEYFIVNQRISPSHLFCKIYHGIRFRKLGLKLGFSIGSRSLGYGVVIPHYGTIVVGGSNRIGNYAVLHTSTCISDNSKVIGDALYLATGAKMTSRLTLGDNVSVGANSVVNKSFHSDCMIAGAPAVRIKDAIPWYERDGGAYANKVERIEELKQKINL